MIPALCAAPDGGFWALERTSSYPAPDGGIISERSGSNSYRLLHFAADGSLETEFLLDSGAISADTFLARMQADSAGNVVIVYARSSLRILILRGTHARFLPEQL